MRRTEEFLVSHMRQRIFTEYTSQTAFGIGCLHEKLLITADADPTKFKMRLSERNGNKTDKPLTKKPNISLDFQFIC